MFCCHQMMPKVNTGLFIFVCEMGNKNPGDISLLSLKLFSLSPIRLMPTILQIVFSYYLDPISSGNTKSASFIKIWYPYNKNLKEVEFSSKN